MLSCPKELTCSAALAGRRQETACRVLGEAVVKRILGFAFFLLGAQREDIAQWLGLPTDTLLSFLTRMGKLGLDGLRDRRRPATGASRAAAAPPTPKWQAERREEGLVMTGWAPGKELVVPAGNKLQQRVLVLTLAANGLLESDRCAALLDCSPGHARRLREALRQGDVTALLDQRRGQQQDYRMDAEAKAELVLQWAANAATGRDCASEALATDIEARTGRQLAPRTLRHHLQKLGLSRASARLATLIADVKRGFERCSPRPR